MSDLTATQIYYETREFCHRDAYKHLVALRKSLLELKLMSKKALLDNTLFWQQEVEKVKLEKDQEWMKKINLAEAENERLKAVIENLFKCDEYPQNNNIPLWEAENQIDNLSRQLDQKLIHISRLQIALAKMSKEMFELEKSYALLHWQYRRAIQRGNRRSKRELPNSENVKEKHLN